MLEKFSQAATILTVLSLFFAGYQILEVRDIEEKRLTIEASQFLSDKDYISAFSSIPGDIKSVNLKYQGEESPLDSLTSEQLTDFRKKFWHNYSFVTTRLDHVAIIYEKGLLNDVITKATTQDAFELIIQVSEPLRKDPAPKKTQIAVNKALKRIEKAWIAMKADNCK